MSEENKTSSLAESMKMIIGEAKTKTKEQEVASTNFVPNSSLIRERVNVIIELLRTEVETAQLNSPERQAAVRARVRELTAKDEAPLTSEEKGILLQDVFDEIFGFGPLGPLLRDPSVGDICVNGAKKIYVERHGKFEKTNVCFENEKHLRHTIDKIIQPLGLRLDQNCPTVTASLPNGSLVEAAVPPVSIDGPALSIRWFGTKIYSLGQLAERGVMSFPMAALLKAYAKAKVNIIISGLVGSGPLVLLNAISAQIRISDRIVSVEALGELRLQHEHWIRLQAVPANPGGNDEISVRALIPVALRMCPDRLIVGECRGAEGYEFLQGLNTGRSGDMTRITARSPGDCLRRLENMIRLGDPGLACDFARELIANNVQVIVQAQRLGDGKYRISEITEVAGLKGTELSLSTLHRLECEGRDENGFFRCRFVDTGEKSRFVEDIESDETAQAIDKR